MTNIETEPHPTEAPPDSGAGVGNGAGTVVEAPRELGELTSDLIAGAAGAGTLEVEPTLQPPAAAAVTADGVGLWLTNKQVDALYSTYAARFSWMHVAGVRGVASRRRRTAASRRWRCLRRMLAIASVR